MSIFVSKECLLDAGVHVNRSFARCQSSSQKIIRVMLKDYLLDAKVYVKPLTTSCYARGSFAQYRSSFRKITCSTLEFPSMDPLSDAKQPHLTQRIHLIHCLRIHRCMPASYPTRVPASSLRIHPLHTEKPSTACQNILHLIICPSAYLAA